MVADIKIAGDWEEQIYADVDQYFTDHLGPRIAADAKRYCPKHTGTLADSIEDHLEGHSLIVSASGGDGGRVYAAYVELGHRIYHPSRHESGPDVMPPEPFLRPALYGYGAAAAGHPNTNRELYSEAHAQAGHLATGYHRPPHSQPAHLTPAYYAEEPIAVNMAAALLHESPSRRVALRTAENYARRARESYGAQHRLTQRADRAVTYLRRITRERNA